MSTPNKRVKITLHQEGQAPIELETEAFCLVVFPSDEEADAGVTEKVYNWPAGEGWPWWHAVKAIANLMSQPSEANITRSIGMALTATIERGLQMIQSANEEIRKSGPQG